MYCTFIEVFENDLNFFLALSKNIFIFVSK